MRAPPRSARGRTAIALVVAFVALAAAVPASAVAKPRVASINTCTDQLLLALADPEQILGLSPDSRDPERSWFAAEAGRYPRLSGTAEDVLVLKPEIVLAGPFTRRATREFLKSQGVRVVEFDVARSLDDARQQILQMGELLGHPDRARGAVARLDAAIERAHAAASRRRFRILVLSRRGWVSGDGSLMHALLGATGLRDAAGDLGLQSGGFVSLEQIVARRPDLILVADSGSFAEDQGQAFLLHPALDELYPPHRRLVVPERLTVCAGPMLAEALDRLTAEVERVSR